MSFSKYPNQLDDNTSLPPTVDLVTPVKAEVVNRIRDAVIAAQTELGTNPSRNFGTVRARLDSLSSLISSLTTRLSSAETDISDIQATLVSLQNQIDALEADLATEVATLNSTITTNVNNLQSQIDALSAIVAVADQIVVPAVSGIQNTDSTTFTAVGACALNPTDIGHPDVSFALEAILQTTDSSYATSFELYNVTEGIVVSHPSISTTSTSSDFISVVLTVGGSDLPASQTNVLEARIRIASGAAASDRAICKYAAIRATPI